jgi:DnaK suppressor protein
MPKHVRSDPRKTKRPAPVRSAGRVKAAPSKSRATPAKAGTSATPAKSARQALKAKPSVTKAKPAEAARVKKAPAASRLPEVRRSSISAPTTRRVTNGTTTRHADVASPTGEVGDPAARLTAPAKNMKKPKGNLADVVLPDGYRPSDAEPFMSPKHRAYFQRKLTMWKDDIVRETMETLQVLHDDTAQHPDIADRAASESDRALDLRARDRQRKLIAKIDAALKRIEDGSYGYCLETGEPIGLRRLDARPIATLSLEAQERHERRERVYRDD